MQKSQYHRQNTPEKVLFRWHDILIATIFIVMLYQHWQIIVYPFQHEYREAAPMAAIRVLLQGENPYSLLQQPQSTNVYGIFYPLVSVPFVYLFGLRIVVLRAISALFIFLSCGLFGLVLHRWKTSWWLSGAAVLLLYAQLLNTSSLAMPNALGFFLFLATSCIPYIAKSSIRSLLAAALCAVLAFLTKPYFMLGAVSVIAYLVCIKQWRKLMYFSTAFFLLLIASCLMINAQLPLYWSNTIFIHTQVATYSASHLFQQIVTYSLQHVGLVIAIGICAILSVPKKSTDRYTENMENSDALLIGISLLIGLAAFFGKLGGHVGSFIYAYQIISPFFLLLIIRWLDQYRLQAIHGFLVIVVVLQSFLASQIFWNWPPSIGYQNAIEITKTAQNIFGSPAIASVLIEQGKKIQDSGQSEYFISSSEQQLLVGHQLNQERQSIQNRVQEYNEQLALDIRNQFYDLVIVSRDSDAGFVCSVFPERSNLSKYYDSREEIIVSMPLSGQKSRLEIWHRAILN
jgi:hypothetical protein